MLVRFHSQAWNDVTMFGDVARKLLKLMGHSGTVPSAVSAADVPAALERLRRGLENPPPPPPRRDDEDDEDAEPPVDLRTRAWPLIELMEAAAKDGTAVMWEKR